MSFFGMSVRDGLGPLGSGTRSRLARVIYAGPLGLGVPIYLPDFTSTDGPVMRFMGGGYLGLANGWFNDTTKMLTPDFGSYTCVVLAFTGTSRRIHGSYGITLINDDNEVVIDNRNRNAEMIASGTINIGSAHQIVQVDFPEVDAPQVFVKFPQFTDIYVGAITSTSAKFSAEQATSYDYFVVGFRKDDISIPLGAITASLRDNQGRIVFCHNRNYPRMRGCLFIGAYAMTGAGGSPLTDFSWSFPPFDVNDYVMVNTCYMAPDTPTIDKSYAVRREGSTNIRTIRYTMQRSNSTALGLVQTPNTNSLAFANVSLIGGLS